jgi:catechol 2,3-dioxygenase
LDTVDDVVTSRLLSQLAHVELLTPRPQESLDFFTDTIGLYESARAGQSVYLRGWGDYFHHSVVLTEAPDTRLGHIGWRSEGPEALETAVSRIEASGLGEGWVEDNLGHGPAYRYRGPGGHVQEVLWEVERYKAPPELASPFPNRPQRFVPRGIAARHLDHVTVHTRDVMGDVAWYQANLGLRFMEWTTLGDEADTVVFAMLTNNEKSHELGLLFDMTEVPGRLNHLSFWLDSSAELHRAADILLNAGVELEFGPGRHGMGEQEYLYFREPSGIRVELNSGGYRIYQPDWEPVKWVPWQGSNTMYRNLPAPDSMMEGFPHAEGARAARAPGEENPFAMVSVS